MTRIWGDRQHLIRLIRREPERELRSRDTQHSLLSYTAPSGARVFRHCPQTPAGRAAHTTQGRPALSHPKLPMHFPFLPGYYHVALFKTFLHLYLAIHPLNDSFFIIFNNTRFTFCKKPQLSFNDVKTRNPFRIHKLVKFAIRGLLLIFFSLGST